MAVGAVIRGTVSEEWILRVAGPDSIAAIPAAALAGMPLYLGVEAMLPIGMVLVDKGMALGAVMALIISVAGVTLPELFVLSSIFRRRLLTLYAVTMFGIAVGSGYLVTALFG